MGQACDLYIENPDEVSSRLCSNWNPPISSTKTKQYSHFGNLVVFKISIHLHFDLVALFLGIFPTEMLAYSCR